MSREQLIEEIRRVQRAIRRDPEAASPSVAAPDPIETPAPAPAPADDNRANLRHLLSELASRLDRTQEQLLAKIADADRAPAAPVSTGSPEERAILQEILVRLDQGGGRAFTAHLEALEARIERALVAMSERSGVPLEGGPTLDLEPLEVRLVAIEDRLNSIEIPAGEAAPVDLEPVTSALEQMRETLAANSPAVTVDLEAVEEKLERLEERLGGDAGAMTLGAAIARLSDENEKVLSRFEEAALAAATGESDPGALSGFTEKLNEILTAVATAGDGDEEAITKAIGTLKRDFSLLVHTINGHLQESRNRSEQVENTLEQLKQALGIQSAESADEETGSEAE